MDKEKIEGMRFEEALGLLAEAVEQLEEGELSLDEALALFEHGQRLAVHCQAQLESASLRVEQLTAEGEIVVVGED
ncbi:MAG TPA: exodeoxyribonuclease VII small subunit [Anaerolineae bacterium]|nr:exodeoxyribonuclease VII small subunit [Anaerolineae bacterium]